MKSDWISSDRIINKMTGILENCAKELNIELISLVLYGSRAGLSHSSQSDYEMMVLVSDNVNLSNFIKLINVLRIELIREKLFQVKILAYTPEIFEDILYNDKIVGTFLYMIAKENIILYDRNGFFTAIKERISANSIKDEEVFMKQCIEFAKNLESDKWKQKWEKTLMQYNYLKKRREF